MASLFTIDSGFGETQGRRDTMEDTHVVFDDILKIEDIGITSVPGQRVSFYGVYDGHGGVDAARMVQADLHKNVVSKQSFAAGEFETALTEGFIETDEKIVRVSNEEGWMNGSTGVAGILVDHKLYIANVGDSEACLVSVEGDEIKTENLTTPHKASDPIEKKRVEELGGHVFFGRVFGALAVSRSFGDSKFKKPKTSQNFVSCEPALHVADVNSHHKLLILACDGLWDVMNHGQAAEFALAKIKEGQNAKETAASLVSEALRRKTEDNVTVVVVIFHHNANGAPAATATATTPSTANTESPSSDNTAAEATTPASSQSQEEDIPKTPLIHPTENPSTSEDSVTSPARQE